MMSPLMLTATLLVIQVPASGVTPDAAVPGGALPGDETAGGAIEGVVRTREGADVRPLPFAIIQASMPGKQRTILADSFGAIPFRGGAARDGAYAGQPCGSSFGARERHGAGR